MAPDPTRARVGCRAVSSGSVSRSRSLSEASICTLKGFLHWIVPRERFRLLTPRDALVTYIFNTGSAQHYFCRTCGNCSFYVPRSHPDSISVDAHRVAGFGGIFGGLSEGFGFLGPGVVPLLVQRVLVAAHGAVAVAVNQRTPL